MNTIPKEILERLPTFEPDKYNYSWGPIDKRPGLEIWDRSPKKWQGDVTGYDSTSIYRWPKPRKRWEIIPENERKAGDRFQAGTPDQWERDFSKWPIVESGDLFDGWSYIFIREIKEDEA